ncbi:hypothetical protein BDA99DRAFT_571686 [Phascolomyces articulosus]|uniref:DUF7707 domain-containing protein n=1 Tax=Phascolomyces articulosus TaxID=60185 RepID=A0AAD5K109_9FUNG|nr:hypothetical protein BDA99DRAFT_571686 [Phascolomyces articulosus]
MIMIRFYVFVTLYLIFTITIQSCQGGSIDSISNQEREKLCNETQAACADACYHQKQESKCNSETLVWGCSCNSSHNKNNTSTSSREMIGKTPLGTFPIPKKMCLIDLALCHSSCQHLGEHGNAAKICRLQCAGSFPCQSSINPPIYNGTTPVTVSSSTKQRDIKTTSPQQQSSSSINIYSNHNRRVSVVLVVLVGMIMICTNLSI